MNSRILRGGLLAPVLLAGVALLTGAAQVAGPEDVIRAKLKAVLPADAQIISIKPSPIPGLYTVNARDYEPVLVSPDGRYLIQGDMLEVKGNKLVEIEDQSMAEDRKAALAGVNPADMIVFPAAGKAKAAVYVFTDVDCGYCRKLHKEIGDINRLGIEVRYLAFPRSGIHTPASAKMDRVWCAADRRAAITQAKNGQVLPVAPAGCKSPVDSEYQLGVDIGVRGTPAVFTTDGIQVGGYVPADELAKRLDIH